MNEQEQLKLQAYLDGELAGRDREDVAEWLDERADARALLAELQHTRAALHANEPEHRLECSREFYWNRIQREIAGHTPGTVSPLAAGLAWLRHHLAPVAGVGVGLAVLVFAFFLSPEAQAESEWEVLNADTAMVNYRDFENGITVVMLYDRTTPGFTSGD